MRLRNIQAGVLTAAIVALVLPATATARPRIQQGPRVAGDAIVGQVVRAVDYAFTGGQPSWRWYRCQGGDFPSGCSVIDGATTDNYQIADADVGRRLRVFLLVRSGDGSSAWAYSPATDAVEEPPPPPEPTPTPTPAPEPTPAPAPAPVLTPQVPAGAVLPTHATKPKPRMMRPAPKVRIRGRTTPGGARITLLSVTAPRGAAISISCIGRSCPVKRWAKATMVTRIARFERVLAAGTKLTIRVTKPGRIGKYTRIVIRALKPPQRRDRCLNPGSSRPRACPAK